MESDDFLYCSEEELQEQRIKLVTDIEMYKKMYDSAVEELNQELIADVEMYKKMYESAVEKLNALNVILEKKSDTA